MRYEEFKCFVSAHTKKYLPMGYADVEVAVVNQQKNNGVKTELLAFGGRADGILSFSLELMFKAYEMGETVETIMKTVADSYVHFVEQESVSLPQEFSYEAMKDDIFVSVRNAEMNQDVLCRVPHETKEDLALVYQARVEMPNRGWGTVLIHHSHLKKWGIDEDTLKETAWNNMHRYYPPELMDMEQLMCRILGLKMPSREESSGFMYVLTDAQCRFGSVYVFDENLLKEIGEKLGGDYYVLPSTIHELVLVKNLDVLERMDDLEWMREMVRTINREEVRPEDVLSDEVYRYSCESNTLTRVFKETEQGMKMTM